MRVIVQDSPGHILNQGTVVFHAGANVASRWEDFQEYSEADKQFFEQLLPMEVLDFSSADELVVTPRSPNTVEVRGQSGVQLEEIPLIENDTEAMKAIQTLQERGYSPDDVRRVMELQPVPTTKARERQAARAGLDMRIKTEVGRILAGRKVNPQAKDLDTKRLGRTNFVVLKAAIDNKVNAAVGRATGERSDFTRQQLDTIDSQFDQLVQTAEQEVFNA